MPDPIVGSAALNAVQINHFLNKEVMATLQKHKILAAVQKRGKVEYNCSSQASDWIVNYRDRDVTWGQPGATEEAPQVNRHRVASLPWRKFYVAESFTKFDLLANQGKEARAKIWESAVKSLARSCAFGLGRAMYVDGNATGYTDQIHGFESCLATTGSQVASGPVYAPSDTYAGLNTTLGYYAGDATAFPAAPDPEACFWSPMLIDPTYAWGGSTHTWATHWREALSYANMYQSTLRNGNRPDVWYMTSDMLLDVKNSLTGSERIQITRGPERLMASLGWDAIEFEGTELIDEIDCPSGTAYGVCFDNLMLRSMQSQLFMTEDFPDNTNSTKVLRMDFYGNLFMLTPGEMVKVYNFSG